MKWLALVLLLAACSKERERVVGTLSSKSAKERAQAVKALAPHAGDDEVFAALTRAVHDGSPAVRSEAAAALAMSKREDAVDAVAPLLRDPDDAVRIAAARALGSRCGDRATAYLRLAFAHSDAAVRAEEVEALRKCGVPLGELLRREETERRRKALAQLQSAVAAQKAHGARELGLLGRDEDAAALLPLLEDRDGVVVAAAARALGDAGAASAAPKLAALVGEGGEVAAAAAEALLALQAQSVARPALQKLARVEGEEAVPAAVALGRDCAAALEAANPTAAAILAAECEAAPFAARLEKGGHRDALLAALLQARGKAPQDLARALSRLLRAGDADVRLPQLALRYGVAGPALVEALRKEQAARAQQIAAKPSEPDEGSAAEIARAPAPGMSDKEKYDRLMARLKERDSHLAVKTSAATRLGELLQNGPRSDRRDFIAAALRAALSLKAPGAERVAALFAADPDPLIADAARGAPEPPPRPPPAPVPLDPRTALYSDDGAVRAQACSAADPALQGARLALAAADPERRVRLACGATNETAHSK
jgi:hypothetical protein